MNFTDELLQSIAFIREENFEYYNELVSIYEKYKPINFNSLAEYVQEVFKTNKRSYFTICSKESFNELENRGNWQKGIIYSPLNDHSRCFMHKGDIVFCYRQGQFDSLDSALDIRGIYAIGFVASEPQILFPNETGHNQYGVCILFPLSLSKHLELRNIQLNPVTISLTPYNGNRNDALQYISEEKHAKAILSMLCRKNKDITNSLSIIFNQKIESTELPTEIWQNKSYKNSPFSPSSPEQIIYYGVPGSGKSYKIDQKINAEYLDKNKREEHTMRVVFHPEYTNADFVGQIVPRVDGDVEYRFKAGPFSRILKRAYQNPNEKYYLVIEEINRGNAAAIFGDLFQLLDRAENGFSQYSIENLDINSYIRSQDNLYNDKEVSSTVNIGGIDWTENTGIRLPPNLSLFATMNTSDQNVFTLDNAFQRRWDMELVKNECTDETQNNAELKVKEQSITWKDFQQTINEFIGKMANESGLSSMEDKRLGCWFVKAENGEIKESVFVNKVLKYLWDDAFKFSRSEVFEGDIKTFEELQEKFLKIGFDIFRQECGLREKIKEINKLQINEPNSQSIEPTTEISNSQE